MATPRIPSQNKANNALKERLNKYVGLVQSVFDSVSYEAARIASSTGYDNENGKEFRFSDYPKTKGLVEEMQKSYVAEVGNIVMRGTSREWKESNLVQDAIANKCIKSYNIVVDGEKQVYLQTNDDALKAFQHRKDKGMNLSQKLWKQSADVKEELESAISCGLSKGTSAVTLSKRLSQYLVDFDSLKDDYKERFGHALAVKDCEYNSIRLSRSEINMAYRRAEQERWEQMDFVVGYEIHTSTNRHRHTDICDELQGKYPKDFEWYGWHPNCTCYRVPILKTEEEFFADEDKVSVNEVTDLPDNFKYWYAKNYEKISEAKGNNTLPYFIKDNSAQMKVIEDMKAIENLKHLSGHDRAEIKELKQWAKSLHVDTEQFDGVLFSNSSSIKDIKGAIVVLRESIDVKKDKWIEELSIIDDVVKKAYRVGENAKANKLIRFSQSHRPNVGMDMEVEIAKLHTIKRETLKSLPSEAYAEIIRPNKTMKVSSLDIFGKPTEEEIRLKLEMFKDLYGDTKPASRAAIEKFVSMGNFDGANMVLASLKIDPTNPEFRFMMESKQAWNDMTTATDLTKIPKRWRHRFKEIVERVEKHDIDKNGIDAVWHDIREAHNIYRLSTNEDVRKYGLYRISHKMPVELIEGLKGVRFDPFNKLINQKMFDALDRYVPLVNGRLQEMAHFSSTYDVVTIDFTAFDASGRFVNEYYKNRIFYHEYGHAMANGKWENNEEWIELFHLNKKWLQNDWEGIVKKFEMKMSSSGMETYMEREVGTQINDILESLSMFGRASENYGGHSLSPETNGVPYWNLGIGENKEYYRITEYIAHASELYWMFDLPVAKEVLESWHGKMTKMYEKFMKRNK